LVPDWICGFSQVKGAEMMTKKDWSNYGLIVFIPILFVALVYATEAFTRNSFFVCGNGNCAEPIPANIWNVLRVDTNTDVSSSTDIQEDTEGRKVIALRYNGRMNWFFLGEIFLYACLGSLVIAATLTFQLFSRLKILAAGGVIALSAIIGLFFHAHPEIHMAVFLILFEKAITDEVPVIAQTTNFLNSLGNAAIFALLLTICASLLPSQDESAPLDMKQLSTRIKYQRIVLYTGTFLLVTAMLLKKSIYQWSLAYTSQAEVLEFSKNFLAGFLTLEGGFYTLVLAAAYFPAALVLQRRAQVLIGLSVDEPEMGIKLKEHGINFSLKESLPHILAVLGPFLTGPVGDLLTGSLF